ncbi:MAG: Thioredoxin-disulfide reductase [Clostridia bacterium]|jgi:thioredoxin reductase (NADPH)|nr:Thioredoxin-disulfide reductase [Clostridia bacterium]
MIDIAIIGAGPAGLSAAINGVIRNKKVKVFGNPPSTSYIYKAERVDNYIGMLGVNGKDMMNEFVNHAKEMGVPIQIGKVIEIFPMGDYYMLNVENEFIEARTVILANGFSKGTVLEGENEFLGKGVSYCATCDGPLYRGKTVAVIGDSDYAEEDANYLSEVCEKVYYIPQYKDIKSLNANVEVLEGKPKKILGETVVERIQLNQSDLEVSGVFIIKQNIPSAKLLQGLEMENKAVKVNKFMETNMKGIYAAGDCTGRPYQVAKAIGEGNVAALQAVNYLHSFKK